MLRLNKKRVIVYLLIMLFCAATISGCNKEDADANQEEAADGEKISDDSALENAMAEALNSDMPAEDLDDESGDADGMADGEESNAPVAAVSAATAEPKAIAERSPVEITRIEVEDDPDDDEPDGKSLGEDEDEHDHEPTPNLFKVDKCQVEVNGIYKVKLAKDLLKEINSRRADRSIPALSPNTSLHACADARCKEQTYFVGHFRPNGSSFDSVGPGYVQGECIAVEYRTVNDIMEAWFAVNDSRYQIMNPDYKQVGISIYDIDGIYYIAAEFGY